MNGAIVGGARGALIGSGAGIGVALTADFGAGALGSAAEQLIGTGSISAKESIKSGVINAVTGRIYGTGEIKSVGNAFLRGAAAGGAGSGLNYLSDALTPRPGRLGRSSLSGLAGMMLAGAVSAAGRDPRRGCEGGRRGMDWLGAQMAYGYQYDRIQPAQKESGFSFADFGKEVLGGAVTGGLASAAFYGAGKAIRALVGSIRSNKASSVTLPTKEQMHNAVTEWSKMEESLASSKRQVDRFNTATIVYDAPTGNYYYGMNRGVQISGESLNGSLESWLPERSLNQYRLGNCAEVDAVNQALNNGADINNLYLYTINTKNYASKAMCENCVYTFADKVADVLSH